MLATSAPGASASSASLTITQTYSCSTGIGTLAASATVTGRAAENAASTKINMTKVVFTVTNPVSSPVTVNNIKASVPDPNPTSAPYVTGSAAVGATPPGWSAGHDGTGVFALFAGSMTIAAGGTVSNAPLSAKYKDKGPVGTVINFKPGQISFNVTSPISTTATCTPTSPGTFATVME